MNNCRILALLVMLSITPSPAWGHGDPFEVRRPANGRLATDRDQGGADLVPVLGSLTSDTPGLTVLSPSDGVPTGTQLAVAAIDHLWFNDGSVSPAAAPLSVSLVIQNATDDFITVTGTTGVLPGPTIGTYTGVVGWHDDYLYTLNPGNADFGAYGVLLQLFSPNHPEFKPSAPFAVVFNNGLDDAVFDGLADALANKALSTGDVNFDGIVDISDVQTVAANWLATTPHHPSGDANHDDIVDISDVQTIAINWLHLVGLQPGGAGSTVPVPEPASAALALAAACAVLLMRPGRKRRAGNH